MSRSRILRLVAIFVAVAVALAAGLFDIAVLDRDEWLERSLRNRWAFRDVPTRRGAIVDAGGVPLAWDVPGFDLELRYATFREEHPLAICVHGANLAHAARDGHERYDLLAPERAREALRDLLAIPLAWLRDPAAWPLALRLEPPVEDLRRELRFHVGGAVAALAGVSRWRLAAALHAEVFGEGEGDVTAALARIARRGDVAGFTVVAPSDAEARHELVERCLAALDQRIVELRALDARLQRALADGSTFELFAFLDERRLASREARRLASLPEAESSALADAGFWAWLAESSVPWHEWPDWRGWLSLPQDRRAELVRAFATERARRIAERAEDWFDAGSARPALFAPLPPDRKVPRFEDERRPRRVLARLPHELAMWLALIAERQPGFLLRASVLRERGRVPGQVDLGSLASVVGSVGSYAPEGRTPELDAARVLADEADFARRADEAAAGLELAESVTDALRSRAESALRAHYGRLGRIGRSGVEAAYDEILAGRPGLRFVERDKRARELRMFENLDVAPGADVQLTVDLRLQVLAERALGELSPEREKALVVLDAQSGDVLAIVAQVWRKDDPQPQWSTGAWAPAFNPYVGSVAKPLVALEFLAALRADPALGAPAAFPDCGGKPAPYDRRRRLRCGEVHGAGARDTVHAIAESCNVYFFRVADELGAERIRAGFARFGWASPGAAAGGVDGSPPAIDGLPSRQWQAPRLRPAGFVLPMQAIGYGVEVWPLFVARAYAGIATGRLPELRIVRSAAAGQGAALPFDATDFAPVRAGLAACVETGTARAIATSARRLALATGLRLFGKTGTAEVTADGTLNNAWFAGFVGEGHDARLAFAAVEYRTDDHGGTSAAPIVARFLDAMLDDPELSARWLGGRPAPRDGARHR
ncbi:MAG: hypothetical protein IT457_09575 [Planctomycetes bacterium]|nr:hypothetical protein [Planctomycetota bacterium]